MADYMNVDHDREAFICNLDLKWIAGWISSIKQMNKLRVTMEEVITEVSWNDLL